MLDNNKKNPICLFRSAFIWHSKWTFSEECPWFFISSAIMISYYVSFCLSLNMFLFYFVPYYEMISLSHCGTFLKWVNIFISDLYNLNQKKCNGCCAKLARSRTSFSLKIVGTIFVRVTETEANTQHTLNNKGYLKRTLQHYYQATPG